MDKGMNKRGVEELSLRLLLRQLLRKWWLIGLVAAVSGVVAVLISYSMVDPVYRSSAMFYANINIKPEKTTEEEETKPTEPVETKPEEEEEELDSGTITASRDLVDSYRVILHTGETLRQLAQVSGVSYSTAQLREMVQMVSVGGTEVFQVTVSGHNRLEVYQLAQAVSQILPQRIMEIVENTRVQIVEAPVPAPGPSAPSHMLNGLIGIYTGILFSVGLVVLLELLRIRIHSEEDIGHCTDLPVLASVPDLHAMGRESYYGYVSRLRSFHDRSKHALVGKQISFEASEAYKLLRIKLELSEKRKNSCYVIGVTGTGSDEGKSLTATNLAYALSLTGQRVLLMDGDMRRPGVGVKLPVVKTPGLSDWLCGLCDWDDLIQPCGLREEENAFRVIASGSVAPNPVELLSGKRFAELLARLRQEYTYIIIDLPSADVFSDALVVSEQTDTILLVVRRGLSRCRKLRRLSEQLRYMNRRVAGIVYNCAPHQSQSSSARRYFHRSKRDYRGNYIARK